jgi:hypothetical protein
MAEHRPAAAAAGPARGQHGEAERPSQSVIYWRYLLFWLLLLTLVYFVTLYGIVAEA